MSKNKIRVQNTKLHVIEVNDDGDTIEFDFTDPNFPLRLLECYDQLDQLTIDVEKEINEVTEREDVELNEFMTQNQKDLLIINDKYFKKAREVMDLFLGEGACQKIFGDKNWDTMYEDLFASLEPEFKKMGVNFNNMQKKAASKHKPKANNKAI